MKIVVIRNISVVIAAVLLCCFVSVADAQGRRAKARKNDLATIISDIVKGDHYLGGQRPGIELIDGAGNFSYDYQNRKYVRRLKVFVRRSGGDKNGTQILYNTKTYGTALKHLTGWKPSLQAHWAAKLFLFGYSKKFHPIKLVFYYMTALRRSDGSLVAFNTNPKRRAKGEKSFVEELPWALAPGEYQIGLSSEVALGAHPISDLMAIWDWYEFVEKVTNVKLPKVLDIAQDLLKFAIKAHLTRTEARYRLVVKAKVPKFIGMDLYGARLEAEKWNLRLVPANTTGCHNRQYGKIVKQQVEAGTLFDPRKGLAVKICARRPAATPTPKPTAAPVGVYYLFKITNCGNGLFIGTETELRTKVKGAIKGCGMDWSTPVTFARLAGPFSTTPQAGAALCAGITYWYHNAVVPHGPYAVYKGSTYPAFESSVKSYVLNCRYTIVK